MEKINIKLLGISCGHRSGRNTAWLTLYALKAAEKACRLMGSKVDVEIELIDLADKKKRIESCIGCDERCGIGGNYGDCPVKNDYLTEVLIPKMMETDGFVFGSPVYTGSYTSKFITVLERFRAYIGSGYFNKPAGIVTTASIPFGGQEMCLNFMDMCIRAVGIIPVQWLNGATGISGHPYGPLPGDDKGKEIGAKKDRFEQWGAIHVGRRVAEIAVLQKISKRRLGEIYSKEFIQSYRYPVGDTSWNWKDLDSSVNDYMIDLGKKDIEAFDESIISRPPGNASGKNKCKILGLSFDNIKGRDTSWLVLRGLKAIEKFGKKVQPVGGFETEFIELSDKEIRSCLNCNKRFEIPNGGKPWKGEEYPNDFGCIIKDDYFSEELMPRIAEADGFIFGSSVSALSPSFTFRKFAERIVGSIWFGHTNKKPTTNIAVSYENNCGQDSCLNMMNICNRWVELIPVSWTNGTGATGGRKCIEVKNDKYACFSNIFNSRRVAEFALMTKTAKQELGNIYEKNFYRVIHPPHGEAGWEWTKLDKDVQEYMEGLSPKTLSEVGKGK